VEQLSLRANPQEFADTRLHQLSLGTIEKPSALKIILNDLASDETRKLVRWHIATCGESLIESTVFDVLMPIASLSFTESG